MLTVLTLLIGFAAGMFFGAWLERREASDQHLYGDSMGPY